MWGGVYGIAGGGGCCGVGLVSERGAFVPRRSSSVARMRNDSEGFFHPSSPLRDDLRDKGSTVRRGGGAREGPRVATRREGGDVDSGIAVGPTITGPLGGGARTGADAVEVLEPSPREEVEPRPQRQGGEEREGEEDGARGEARRRRERADEGLLPRVHVRVREVGHRRHGRALRGDGLRGAHRRPRGARDDGVMYK
jgi:hypothetical protein